MASGKAERISRNRQLRIVIAGLVCQTSLKNAGTFRSAASLSFKDNWLELCLEARMLLIILFQKFM
jgi:hypothetical protein